MNYARGRQIIIHDPRLKSPLWEVPGPPSEEQWDLNRLAVAPEAWWNLDVDPKKDTVANIFGTVMVRGNIARMMGVAELDALHIMAHGLEGSIELGKDWLHRPTMSALNKISGMFRYVVIHSCLVGKPPKGTPSFMTFNTFGGSLFARKAAELTKSSVVVARESQIYSIKRLPDPGKGELFFGDWEGPIDVYRHGESVQSYNGVLDGPFDLEKLIFGAAKKP